MAECWKSLQQPITGFRPRQSRVLVQSFPLRFSIRKTDAKPNVSGFASGRKRSGVTKLSHESVEARDAQLVLTSRAQARQIVAGNKFCLPPPARPQQAKRFRGGVKRGNSFCRCFPSCGVSLGSTRFFCHKRNGWNILLGTFLAGARKGTLQSPPVGGKVLLNAGKSEIPGKSRVAFSRKCAILE